MIKAIVFDLGGCLLCENDIKMTIQEEVLEKKFGNINFNKEYFSWASNKLQKTEGEIKNIILNLLPRLYSLREEGIFEKISNIHPGIRYGIATNHISEIKNSLSTLGILEKCDTVLISGDCGYEKPSKEFFNLLFEKIGLAKNEILFVDDSNENIKSADDIGLHTLYYQRGTCLSESILTYLEAIDFSKSF